MCSLFVNMYYIFFNKKIKTLSKSLKYVKEKEFNLKK